MRRFRIRRDSSEIDGYKVTSIGKTSEGCRTLASVVIPDGVTSIGDYAFYGCGGLTSVTIPNSVTSIGDAAFYECCGLTSVTIPNSVASILDYAFSGCNGLTSVTIPGGVTSIGDHAFYNCSGLTSVVIQAGVTRIGWKAFYCCSNLTSVTIPDSVTNIELDAFADCPLLYDEKTMKGLDLVDGWIVGYNSDCPSDLILENVRGIAGSAFKDCSGLTSVTMSDSVTSIGVGAFEGCQGLADLDGFVIVKEVLYDYIGGQAVVTIPSGVTSISRNAFKRCSSLMSVTIPNSVTSIEYAAFSGCSNLAMVTIPNSVTSIDIRAFESCSSLTSVMIPNSVTSIGSCAFSFCTSLTSVTIPNGVTSIDDYVFSGCSNLAMVTMPNSVTSIGDGAFYSCSSLASVSIPDSVTSIGYEAFAKCGLSEVSVSERTKIDESAFDSGAVITRRPAEVIPSVDGDEGASVTGDAETGFVVTPSDDATEVVVTIPSGADAAKVTVKVSPKTKTVTPNGAAVRVVRSTADITDYLDISAADALGVIDLNAATVKEEIAKEPFDAAKGAVIDFASPSSPSLTTAPTREGLVYRLKEGLTLEAMEANTTGATKVGDGKTWTPTLSVTGGSSGFYTIQVTK